MSDLLVSISSFFLSSWLWGLTRGIAHLPISCIIMTLFLIFIARISIRRAIILALLSHLFAGLIFLGAFGLLINYVGFIYNEQEFVGRDIRDLLWQASIDLALIYATLEIIFFIGTRRWYHASIQWLFMAALVSNGLAAWCIYRFLPLVI